MKVELYDSTLRDGMGGAGIDLTADERLLVVRALDRLGIDIIEAGFPTSNPKEERFFALLADENLSHSQLAAFGMTRRKQTAVEDDPGLILLAESSTPIVTLVGKASRRQVETVLGTSDEENLAMIAESIAYLKDSGKRVIFDAEHFFDGFLGDSGYALACLEAAREAECITLCDTNGGSLPSQVRAITAAAGQRLAGQRLGIHSHNDGGCAVANSLVAIEEGASQVQGTINGIGERTGNANLVTIIANLQLKMNHSLIDDDQLAALTETSRYIDQLLNRNPGENQPYVGKNAFTHKAGMHAAKEKEFEHIDPGLVGNKSRLLVSEIAGKAAIAEQSEKADISLGADESAEMIRRVKELEELGYQFEQADGSLELLIRQEKGLYRPLFTLESWRVISEKRADQKARTEATIKINVAGERRIETAEGNGPVNALDQALRQAISDLYPDIDQVTLSNYHVRILNENRGTEAVTRVLLESSDQEKSWGSVGVSENVIEASWQALVDSLEYYQQNKH